MIGHARLARPGMEMNVVDSSAPDQFHLPPNASAVELLARELWSVQDHLDPGEGDWETFDDRDKEFYRQSVKWLLAQREALAVAMGPITTV